MLLLLLMVVKMSSMAEHVQLVWVELRHRTQIPVQWQGEYNVLYAYTIFNDMNKIY
jgi:hypothetical protein